MDIIQRAKEVLYSNLIEFDDVLYISPRKGRYPEQFFWDSGFHTIVMRHFNIDLAKKEILTFLKAQWNDGFIPHMIFWNTLREYPGEKSLLTKLQNRYVIRLYQMHKLPPTSRLIGPPVIGISSLLIWKKNKDHKFALKVVDSFYRFFKYLFTNRDPDNDFLVSVIHPWETGLDDSPIFDEFFGFRKRKLSSTLLYDFRYLPSLLKKYRRLEWDLKTIFERDIFNFETVIYNSILLASIRAVMILSKELGRRNITFELEELVYNMAESIDKKLWSAKRNAFLDLYTKDEKIVNVLTSTIFLPMLTGMISKDKAEALVNEHLLNKEEFWCNGKIKYLVPTVAINEPMFSPGGISYKIRGKHWRGPIWMNMNWMIVKGLLNYGFNDEARTILKKSIEILDKYGFYEKYDPRNGKGLGAKNQSWATSIVELLLDFTPLFNEEIDS